MKKLLILGMGLLLAAGAAYAKSAPALVDVAWIKANSCKQGVVVLDIRGGAKGAYKKGHIPCAIPSSYGKDGWRVKRGKVPGMLPGKAQLEKLIGGLGISNSSHVVVVAPGAKAADMGSATRVFWTFKVLGHENVSILDGGFKAYVGKDMKKPKNKLAKNAPKFKPARFKAGWNGSLLATADDVSAALKKGVTMVDGRPSDQFLGISKSGMVARPGTLPGAKSLPALWTTANGGGKFRSKNQLDTLFDRAKVSGDGEQITFCNTGHWASLSWFVSYELMGNKKARMYDGSMTDWARVPARPMQTHVTF